MKTCSKCGETKPLDDFGIARKAKDGHFGACRLCRAKKYRADREAVLAYQATYREANREAERLRVAAYRARPDFEDQTRRERKARRRAREMNAFVETVDPAVVWDRDGGICHICQKPADPTDWHLDHVKPLARGGEHSYANTAVSHPVCNLRKGARWDN